MTGLYGPSAGIIADTIVTAGETLAAIGAFMPNAGNEHGWASGLSISDGKQGFVHAWVRLPDGATSQRNVIFGVNSGTGVAIASAVLGVFLEVTTGQFTVRAEATGNAVALTMTSSVWVVNSAWRQVMAGWDLAATTHWMSVDGVQVTSFNGAPTNVNTNIHYANAFGSTARVMIAPNMSADFGLTAGTTDDGMAELIFCTSYLSMESAHSFLRSSGGKPKFVGSYAQDLWAGSYSQFYFTSPRSTSTPNSFWGNNGNAGTFTASGGLTLSGTSPAD